MKKFALLMAVFATLILSGCADQVPPGHKGKIMGKAGYNPEVLKEGRYRIWGYDELVLLDMTTNLANRTMSVRMNDRDSGGLSRPGLDMDFVLAYRYRLRDNVDVINTMFHDIKVDPKTGVTAHEILRVYADSVIESTFRDVIGTYEPEEVLANRAVVGKKFSEALSTKMQNNPIELSDVMIKSMTLPKTISDKIDETKKKELDIIKEQANQAIELVKRNNLKVLASKQAEIDLVTARSVAEQNKELSKGLSDTVLELRRLDIAKIQAEAFAKRMEVPQEGDSIIIPYEALSNIGAQSRMMAK